MKILKKKALWLTLYAICITLVFLYLLFPSDIAKNKLEESASSSDVILKTGSLKPSLPFGFKIKNVNVSSGSSSNVYFQGEVVDLQFHPFNLFRKKKQIGVSGKAYGGIFSGHFQTAPPGFYPPREGSLKFNNIDLGEYAFLKTLTGKQITGKTSGNWTHSSGGNGSGNISGTMALFLNKGSYPLAEPFLGLSRIDFDRGEIQAKLENRVIKIEKLQIFSPQMDCALSGEIALAEDFKNSPITMSGEMILSGRKVKMNIHIEGTIANPSLRYM